MAPTRDSKHPLVSVIMPVFNAEKWLRYAIDSVLDQHYKHIELLVINNGSTDKSHEHILSYQDQRIRYFHQQKNMGVSAARNIGLNHMTGDFFCFLDADDLMPEKAILSRLKIMIDRM